VTLSYRASGLLAHLRATVHPGQPIDTPSLARPEHREGRDAVRAMLRELETAGHVQITRAQDARGRWSWSTTLLPHTGNTQVEPKTENPASVNTNPQVTPKTAFPASVHPASDNPESVGTEFPQVTPKTGKPASENPPHARARAVLPTPVGSGSTSSSELTTQPRAAAAATRTSAAARTRDRLTDLNATAVRHPDAWALVSTWAHDLAVPIRSNTQRALARQVDDLLTDLGPRADLTILRTALDRWARDGRTPRFLVHAYDDAARAHRAATTPPTSTDVPGSRVHQPAQPTKRLAKALAALHPDDPFLSQFQAGAEPAALPPGEFRVIEGGRSA